MDSWVDASEEISRHYIRTCSVCETEIDIIQYGEPLSEALLSEIIAYTHQENQYDSYLRYKLEYGRWVKINVDIKNRKCVKALPN
jgi:hypothetical protein